MNSKVNAKFQLYGAWCGVVYVVFLGVGWSLFAGFIPPHLPSANSADIAQVYQQDTNMIRVGMILLMFGAMANLPFTGAIAYQLSRIEGCVGILTFTQVMAGLSNAILTFYPALWWLTAAFRPERPEEITYLLNDIGWLQVMGGLTLYLPALITLALAAFNDDSKHPVFPRWSGYFYIWALILSLPGQLLFFFKTGPFAWNGLIAFWLPVPVFCGFFIVTFYLLRKGILRQMAEL